MIATVGNTGIVPASALTAPRPRPIVIGFWLVTALFCLQISFTAYAQLALPQVAAAFTHLGFPGYLLVNSRWPNCSAW